MVRPDPSVHRASRTASCAAPFEPRRRRSASRGSAVDLGVELADAAGQARPAACGRCPGPRRARRRTRGRRARARVQSVSRGDRGRARARGRAATARRRRRPGRAWRSCARCACTVASPSTSTNISRPTSPWRASSWPAFTVTSSDALATRCELLARQRREQRDRAEVVEVRVASAIESSPWAATVPPSAGPYTARTVHGGETVVKQRRPYRRSAVDVVLVRWPTDEPAARAPARRPGCPGCCWSRRRAAAGGRSTSSRTGSGCRPTRSTCTPGSRPSTAARGPAHAGAARRSTRTACCASAAAGCRCRRSRPGSPAALLERFGAVVSRDALGPGRLARRLAGPQRPRRARAAPPPAARPARRSPSAPCGPGATCSRPAPATASRRQLKLVVAVVKPFRLAEVIGAAMDAGASGATVTEAKGFGRQGGHSETYRGQEYVIELVPKSYVELVVPDDKVDGGGRRRPRRGPHREDRRRQALGPRRRLACCGSAPARRAPTPSDRRCDSIPAVQYLVTAVIKPYQLGAVKDMLRDIGTPGMTIPQVQRRRPPGRPQPPSTAAPSTRSTSCRRCASRSSPTTTTSTPSCRRSPSRPAPGRSATARSGSPSAPASCGSAPANWAPTPSNGDVRTRVSSLHRTVHRQRTVRKQRVPTVSFGSDVLTRD